MAGQFGSDNLTTEKKTTSARWAPSPVINGIITPINGLIDVNQPIKKMVVGLPYILVYTIQAYNYIII